MSIILQSFNISENDLYNTKLVQICFKIETASPLFNKLERISIRIIFISKSQKSSGELYPKSERWHRREPRSHSLADYVSVID